MTDTQENATPCRCPKCGYDINPNEDEFALTCPECGISCFRSEARSTGSNLSPFWFIWATGLCFLLFPFIETVGVVLAAYMLKTERAIFNLFYLHVGLVPIAMIVGGVFVTTKYFQVPRDRRSMSAVALALVFFVLGTGFYLSALLWFWNLLSFINV